MRPCPIVKLRPCLWPTSPVNGIGHPVPGAGLACNLQPEVMSETCVNTERSDGDGAMGGQRGGGGFRWWMGRRGGESSYNDTVSQGPKHATQTPGS